MLKIRRVKMKNKQHTTTIKKFIHQKIVMIYRGLHPKACLKATKIFYDVGFRVFEVTLDSPHPYESLKLLRDHFNKNIILGAGTVLNAHQVQLAYHAGAEFIASPVTSIEVIEQTKRLNLISMPGAMSPTEIF